jgi:hypothetical protein
MNQAAFCISAIISGALLFSGCNSSNPSGPTLTESTSAFDTVRVSIPGELGRAEFSPAANSVFSIGSAGSVDSAYVFAHGTQVLVAAKPFGGNLFVSWSGDLSGSNASAGLMVNGNRNITATFQNDPTPQPPYVGDWRVGGWSWTGSSSGDYKYTACGDTCYLDIRADGTFDGWIVHGYSVVKSTGTYTADNYYLYVISSAGWSEKIIYEARTTSLSLITVDEVGQVHEMCSK